MGCWRTDPCPWMLVEATNGGNDGATCSVDPESHEGTDIKPTEKKTLKDVKFV